MYRMFYRKPRNDGEIMRTSIEMAAFSTENSTINAAISNRSPVIDRLAMVAPFANLEGVIVARRVLGKNLAFVRH